jgi:vacuolar-type H+-ATPase subunit H
MIQVKKDLTKISNAEYQRERLIAMTEDSNKQLISQSYKFILWSILAILVVLALIKLKEMFGQDDVDEDSGGGGILASLLGLFSIGKVDSSDIADKTGEVKAGLASAGEEFMKASDEFSTNITEGADNLVTSASDAATGAVEGAKGLADKVNETATDAVNKVGDAVSDSGDNSATTPATGGKKRKHKNK